MNENFDALIEKLSPTLRRITHRLNGRFTFFNEDDLFQEALLHLWITFNKGSFSDKTDSYILQGCYFYLKNYMRTALDKTALISLNELLDSGDNSLESLISDTSQNISEDVDGILLKEYARQRLSDRERQIIDLSCEGITVREIGERLNISHVMVVKIRAGIKEKLKNFNSIPGYQN